MREPRTSDAQTKRPPSRLTEEQVAAIKSDPRPYPLIAKTRHLPQLRVAATCRRFEAARGGSRNWMRAPDSSCGRPGSRGRMREL